LRPHTAIHPITPAPPGCAGFQPACRVHRHCARIQRYTPSPLHRLGARTSSLPQRYAPPGCAGVSSACRVRGRLARIQRCATWVRGLPARIPRYTAWVRGLPARMPGVQALRPHTAIHLITPAPPGCAGVAPACRVRRRRARIQRYTPSPLHRLGARASSPHAGCTGIAPAYSDTPHHPCTTWVRGLPARMPRAEGHTWQRQWVLDQSLTS